MRIDYINQEKGIIAGKEVNSQKAVIKEEKKISGSPAYVHGKTAKIEEGFIDWTKNCEEEDRGKKSEAIAQAADSVQRLAETMSVQDAGWVAEKGFSMEEDEVDTIVTVVDKIKLELAQGGQDVSVMGDVPSKAQLEKITGEPALAESIEAEFSKNDLPLNQEVCEDIGQAWEMSKELKPVTGESERYILETGKEPTISNLYLAQNATRQGGEETETQMPALDPQIEHILEKYGIQITEETKEQGQWLVKNGIPLTKENLEYLAKLQEAIIPLSPKKFAKAVADAVMEGKNPKDAAVVPGFSLAGQAENILKEIMDMSPENIRDVTARRQLEEIRLLMSVQANMSLLKKGITIDTKNLEALVEELKGQERTYYETLLTEGEVKPTPEKTELLADTSKKLEQLKQMPAEVLDLRQKDTETVNSLHGKGIRLWEKFEQAETAYETVMTRPRKDMGDTIAKAFRNVDDILEDLEIETTPENERAVRILAYNGQPLTKETVTQMKAFDQQVQTVLNKMTPKIVVSMIKEGYNPLNVRLEELSTKIDTLMEETDPLGVEKFSKYLWKLEHNNEISTSEREAYVGIYRLLHQVEKTDGAAIGAVMLSGGEVTMKNLLTQVRSRKVSGMDVQIDENFGELKEVIKSGLSITQQVEMVYQADCVKETMDILSPERVRKTVDRGDWRGLSPEELLVQVKEQPAESEQEYLKHQMDLISEAKNADARVAQILKQFDFPKTALNMIAANQMLTNRNKALKDILENREVEDEVDLAAVKEGILKDFGEALEAPEEMAEAQKNLADVAENVMKTMMVSPKATSVGLRDLKLAATQIKLGIQRQKQEEYEIPMMVADELATVSLKIVRGKEEKGRVDILFETAGMGKVAAQFTVTAQGITGMVASDRQETVDRLKKKEQEAAVEEREVSYVFSKEVGIRENLRQNQGEQEPVQTKRLYGVAKMFLEMVKTA